ncbi:hypothetical protein PR202_ga07090 [Eleusine coracana subsp. coracana]|uniref:Phytocyanin domain-containing protein n=1 Tax=Eleusine coracana subsp. coracana TaxID=191504 RepID=A0AAV5BWK2_ELECO|nr:hypothetical protein PR202_ga07090 [Eleusine coracana subsp. coracana]
MAEPSGAVWRVAGRRAGAGDDGEEDRHRDVAEQERSDRERKQSVFITDGITGVWLAPLRSQLELCSGDALYIALMLCKRELQALQAEVVALTKSERWRKGEGPQANTRPYQTDPVAAFLNCGKVKAVLGARADVAWKECSGAMSGDVTKSVLPTSTSVSFPRRRGSGTCLVVWRDVGQLRHRRRGGARRLCAALQRPVTHGLDAQVRIEDWVLQRGLFSNGANDKRQEEFVVSVFDYAAGAHNVVEVDPTGYNTCTPSAGAPTYTSGHDRITLHRGTNLFICSFPGHCNGGMKIAVTAH